VQPSEIAYDLLLLGGTGLQHSALDTVPYVPSASQHRSRLPLLRATGQNGFDRAVQLPRSGLIIE
jgi:hypothetical protein